MAGRSLLFIGILSLFLSAVPGSAKKLVFKSSEKATHLVELYSTQSCHSCPPAQEWVNQLEAHPGLWKTFIPVVLHVDYWDYLGWKDPFSSNQHTQRQYAYSARWGKRGVYTPMFVLDGIEWKPPNLGPIAANDATAVGILRAKHLGSYKFAIQFKPKQDHGAKLQIHSAVLAQDITTKVKRGENAGKNLHHKFLALSHQTRFMNRKDGSFSTKVELPRPKQGMKHAVVFWISRDANSKPIQATGGILPPPQSIPVARAK